MPGNFFGVDLDPLEERLVEESSFGRFCLEVGVLGAVGELKREVERLGDDVVFDFVAAEEFFGGGAFALFEDRLVAWMHAALGEPERAIALYETTLERARAIGDEYAQAACLDGLGSQALTERRFQEAAGMFLEAHDLYVLLDDRYRIPISVARFAWVLADSGHAAEATQILAAAEAELERIGSRVGWVSVSNDETRSKALEQLGEDAFAEAWRTGEKLTPEAAADLAREALGRTQHKSASG